MVIATMFLVFGTTFGFVMVQDIPGHETGELVLTIMFFAIWIVVCVAIIFLYLRVATGKGGAQANAFAELEFDDSAEDADDAASSKPRRDK